jgi:GT2 family glycosyltransferase
LKHAVMEGADYILWLDSDMVFPSDLLIDMMKSMDEGKDFVTGIYYKRKPPFNPVIYKTIRLGMTEDERVTEEYDDYPDTPFQIDACGFGVVLHKIEIAKKMLEGGGAFQPLPGYGEDISFCIRAKRLGYELWADPKLQCGHIAKTLSDRATFEAWRKNND